MTERIAHLSSTHRTLDVRVYHKECRSMAVQGYDVCLVSPAGPDGLQDTDVRILPVPSYRNRFLRMTVGTSLVWRTALQLDADAYHVHSPELLPLALVARLFGHTVVYDAHEDLPDQVLSKTWIPSRLRRYVSALSQRLLRIAGTRLSGIVAATPAIAEDFPPEKTITVRNFPVEVPEIPDLPTSRSQSQQIIYVGGLSASRGLAELVDAMAIVGPRTHARLLIAGWFIPESFQNDLRDREGWQWVNYVGRVDRNEMNRYLAGSMLGIVTILPAPNHVRSEPNKLFEYMQAGIPVLTSNFDYWRQFVVDAGTGRMVDPRDPEAIAEQIIWFLEHREEAEEMGATGKRLAMTDFSWSSQADTLRQFYSDRILRA